MSEPDTNIQSSGTSFYIKEVPSLVRLDTFNKDALEVVTCLFPEMNTLSPFSVFLIIIPQK
jgi:hypothetical protein